jgi:hypothetical protein
MKTANNTQQVFFASNPTHGTAKQVHFPTVIPNKKPDKEVFWVNKLLDKISYDFIDILPNPDDSNGKPDVIVKQKNSKINVQVTELTYELERTRQNIKKRYLKNVIEQIQSENISSQDRIIINVSFPYSIKRKPTNTKVPHLVAEINNAIREKVFDKKIIKDSYSLFITPVKDEKATIYLLKTNNIGIDANIDQLSRSIALYSEAIQCIVEKKRETKADWLVIWSVNFWRDKHNCGDIVVKNMREEFTKTPISKVYFVESMDFGDGVFNTNLHVEEIK